MFDSIVINLSNYQDYGLTYTQIIEYSSLPDNITFQQQPFYACIKYSEN